MPFWVLIPLLAFSAVIQITILPQVPILGYKPDLALALVVAWALLAPVGEAAVWGFIVGIFLDLASGLPFGINTIALTTVGWLIGWGQATFFRGNLLAPPIAVALATFLHNIIVLGMLALLQWHIDWAGYLFLISLPAALLNVLTLPLVYFPLRFFQRETHPQVELS